MLLFGWAYFRDKSLSTGFEAIVNGATQLDVLRLMGKPKKIEKCGAFLGPLTGAAAGRCATEYVYAVTFAPYVPNYYIVEFDASGHVIDKASLSSP